MIEQYKHPLSTHFCTFPFEIPHRFYGIQRELVNKSHIYHSFPCTFYLIMAIISVMYIAKTI